jgi:hypothetical protein
MTTRLPDWWNWEIELTAHLQKRMEERGLSEEELRYMLETVKELTRDRDPGRWIAEGTTGNQKWRIILEPDEDDSVIVVITAYPI